MHHHQTHLQHTTTTNTPPTHPFTQVEWLRTRIADIPYRLVFESALELMGSTQVGTFTMGAGGQSKGPPPAGARCRWLATVCVGGVFLVGG